VTLGNAIRARREAAGFTQEQLASKAGVALRTLQRSEMDKHLPTTQTLQRIARALGTTASQLLGEAA
jgi:transcriptional regulator with XRE-family HTH domain